MPTCRSGWRGRHGARFGIPAPRIMLATGQRGCAEVIVTTNLAPLIVSAFPLHEDREAFACRGEASSQAPTKSRGLCP